MMIQVTNFLSCVTALSHLGRLFAEETWQECHNLGLSKKGHHTLLKSDVTTRDHVVRCRGSQECGSRNVNFACKFHRRSHRVRITLKSTTLLFMRTRNV